MDERLYRFRSELLFFWEETRLFFLLSFLCSFAILFLLVMYLSLSLFILLLSFLIAFIASWIVFFLKGEPERKEFKGDD